jgi:poly(U)-specific endoribonuclease
VPLFAGKTNREEASTQPQQDQKQEQKLNADQLKSMTLAQAVQHVWDVDKNRLRPDVDYKINVQKGKKPWWKEDKAPDPLFTNVDRTIWQRPTYAAFVALLDNYTAQTGQAENVTDKERAEMQHFLETVLETAPMQFCHEYCHAIAPQRIPADKKAFQQLLHKIWFELYRRERGGPLDSSGFEHVFVGEIRDGVISGFHNWIRFYLEEKKGTLDYRGYIKPKSETEAHADGNDHVLTLQFIWNGVEKQIGTTFIGVSPEFELAIYTICFLVGAENNPVQLRTGTDIFNMNIKVHKMHGDKIGTSYPFVNSHYEK